MSDPLPSVEQLHRELEVCDAATDSPWIARGDMVVYESASVEDMLAGKAEPPIHHKRIALCDNDTYLTPQETAANAALMALARTTLPARIRDVLRLMELLPYVQHGADCLKSHPFSDEQRTKVACTCGLSARLAELEIK